MKGIEGNKKSLEIPGKGQNETLVIVNPMELTTTATDVIQRHVPGSGGT
jgi:hypothetical protein